MNARRKNFGLRLALLGCRVREERRAELGRRLEEARRAGKIAFVDWRPLPTAELERLVAAAFPEPG